MVGVVSGVVLVGVFAVVTWLCTVPAARLYRAGSHSQPRQPGDS